MPSAALDAWTAAAAAAAAADTPGMPPRRMSSALRLLKDCELRTFWLLRAPAPSMFSQRFPCALAARLRIAASSAF